MMTVERAEKLSAILAADPERTNAWLDLEPTEVVAMINAEGHDFTVDEVVEYSEALKAAVKSAAQGEGELGEDDLDAVAGGTPGLVLLGLALSAVVIGIGVKQTKKSKFKW